MAFTILGELGDDFIVFLKRLTNFLVSYDANSKLGSSLFQRVGLAIQKGVGHNLLPGFQPFLCKFLCLINKVFFFIIINNKLGNSLFHHSVIII